MASPIIPISTKNGVVALANGSVFGEEWGMNLTIERDRYKTFEMTPTTDPMTNTMSQVLTGFTSGTGTVRAKYDATGGADLPASKLAWMGATGVEYLGYTSLIGFVIEYTITDVRPAVNTANPGGAMFDFDFEITDIAFTTSGP